MTLESYVEASDQGLVYRIVMTAKSSKFFDAIYKVRSQIDSWFSGDRMSSFRYHNHGEEKKKVKDDHYEVDFEADRVTRNKNGKLMTYSIEHDHLYDPLAYLYRLRALVSEPGDAVSLVLVTSRGDVETVAEVVERKWIRTPFGKREALRVVPRTKDSMMFSKKGHLELWYGADGARLPYRVVFDLSFGKLVAKLQERHARPPGGRLSAPGS
jgi:hypothetical protein